jgi:SnoaL-like polyketide cyclase
MPSLHLTIEDPVAGGDKVVCRNIWRWTDLESGKPMSFRGFVLWRFEGDKIAERWATVIQPVEDPHGASSRDRPLSPGACHRPVSGNTPGGLTLPHSSPRTVPGLAARKKTRKSMARLPKVA